MVSDTPAWVTTTLMVGEGVGLSHAVVVTRLTLLAYCFEGMVFPRGDWTHYVEGGVWFFSRLWVPRLRRLLMPELRSFAHLVKMSVPVACPALIIPGWATLCVGPVASFATTGARCFCGRTTVGAMLLFPTFLTGG